MSFAEQYDFLNEIIGVHEDTLDLAYAIGGRTEETTNAILFYYTGYNSIEQYKECEGEDKLYFNKYNFPLDKQ